MNRRQFFKSIFSCLFGGIGAKLGFHKTPLPNCPFDLIIHYGECEDIPVRGEFEIIEASFDVEAEEVIELPDGRIILSNARIVEDKN